MGIFKKNIKHLTKMPFVLSLLFSLALLFRSMALSTVPFDFWSDDAIYVSMARYLLEGDFKKIFHPMWPPFYPITTSFIFLFIRSWAYASRIVSLLTGSLLVIPIYLLLLRLRGKTEAILASILIILWNLLIVSSIQPMTESLLTFLVWMGVYLSWQGVSQKKNRFSFIAGVLWGLGYLTKVEGFLIICGFIAAVGVGVLYNLVIYFSIRKAVKEKGIHLRMALLTVVGFFMIYAPYAIGMTLRYGSPQFFAKASAHFNLQGSPFDQNKEGTSTWAQDVWSLETVNTQSVFFKDADKLVKKNNILYRETMVSRIKYMVSQYVIKFLPKEAQILFLLGTIGLFFRKTKAFVYFTVLLGVTFVAQMFFSPSWQERYMYWIQPIVPIYIVLGISFIAGLTRKFKVATMVIIFLVLVFAFPNRYIYPLSRFENIGHRGKTSPITEIDLWFSQNDPGKRIFAHHEGYGFYSRSYVVYAPNVATIDELLEYGDLWGVKYMVGINGELPASWEYPYADPKDYPGMKLVAFDRAKGITLYELIY